ncbi:hypothetical protein CVT25_013906 [Psilocybe cyanescens]|uniref:DNA-directed DNA polymerase n=1 Tax=Psilocybe cyanescens TaxID=93625 RepID=A0A409W0Q8_PSICY|nr:hypothetical protein CVT25_013906 [Psilocybe cyanescens]
MTACTLPTWLPGGIVDSINDHFGSMLREEIVNWMRTTELRKKWSDSSSSRKLSTGSRIHCEHIADKLNIIKRACQGGTRVFKEQDIDIYDEVSEEKYKKFVKGRLQRNDFVVDNGTEGYVNNGVDDWTGGNKDARDSEEEDRKKEEIKTGKSQIKTQTSPTRCILYQCILHNSYQRKSPFADFLSNGPLEDLNNASSDDTFSSPHKRSRTKDGAITPTANRLATHEVDSSSDGFDSSYDDINMDDFMDLGDNFNLNPPIKHEEPVISLSKKPALKTAPSNLKEELDVKPAWLLVYDTLAVKSEDTLGSPFSETNINAPKEQPPLNVMSLYNDDERIPEPPSPTVLHSVLPHLIATLVNRPQLLQYDIKQQALKLIANSRVWRHRFCFCQLDVTGLTEALKSSALFKKAVNYRYKLLEIDLDGFFQRLLLLQKKKYVALKVDDGTKAKSKG